jgi:hypothetical protein
MFYIPFDIKFHGEQEYVFSESFRGFFPFEEFKKLEFSSIFHKVELFKLPYSCSALKTELENGLKVVSDLNIYPPRPPKGKRAKFSRPFLQTHHECFLRR